MALLGLQGVSFKIGQNQILEDVALQIEVGERICLLGRNGAGKSTLLKMIAGELAPDDGVFAVQKGARIARLPQEVPQGISGAVYDVVKGGIIDADFPEYEVEAMLSKLGLDGEDQFETLSGGQKRRAYLGRVLMGQPDLLLLDEPTNHLDIESIAWLEEFLLRYVKTLLFVTHDRAFLKRLATKIVEIDRAKIYSYDCDYDTYLVRKEAFLEAEEKQRALFDKRLAQEEAWIRRGVEARRTKAQSRIRDLFEMRAERQKRRERVGNVRVELQNAQTSGRLVVQTEDVNFSFENKPIVKDFSTVVMRGDKIGIIGPNGCGKTTLLRMLLGELQAQSGEIRLGTNLEIAYFDQLRANLDENKSVRYNVAGDNETVKFNGESRHVMGYLQDFLFSPDRSNSLVSVLSGGERNRLLLAKLFTQPANLLVMDEPTNDLDIETLDLLEEMLVEMPATLLLVSHDRVFLNNVATSVLVFEGDGKIGEYLGGYDDYLRQKPKAPVNTPEPKVTPSNKSASAEKPRQRKLSYKENKELEALPAKLESLEKEQAELSEKLSSPEIYSGDGKEALKITARLKEIETELETAFIRWEELLEIEANSQ
jgi:ATP-binding cassette subfamily F protein uup